MKSLCFTICFLVAVSSKATDYTAASGSRNDVNTMLGLLSSGDRGIIPAGTNHWTSGITWNAPANVTLIGAGTTNTGGEDKTVIFDDMDLGSNTPLLSIGVSSTGVFRMTGISIKTGTTGTNQEDSGTLVISGPGVIRIDHCHLVGSTEITYKLPVVYSGVFGLIDHCIMDFTKACAIYVQNGRCGTNDVQGNLEWSYPTDLGGTNKLYVEDNIFNGSDTGDTYTPRVYDCYSGGSVVVRFNTLHQFTLGEDHATGHSGDDRGARSHEAYGNHLDSDLLKNPNYDMIDIGSGTAMVWGNYSHNVSKWIYHFNVTRKDNATYPQPATPSGWGYAGTNFNGTGSMWDGGTLGGTNLDTGYPCVDQPGRGQGDYLSGLFPNKTNVTTGTITWPHQSLEPLYIWANDTTIVSGWGTSEPGLYSETGGRVANDRDYYFDNKAGAQTSPTSPFDGTSGVGWGTLANRPTTCTKGVAYWATDQGSWNQSTSNPYGVQQNGADGVLYVATADNTWTLYYTPYTYPHPLQGVSGGGGGSALKTLRIHKLP